MGLYWFHKNPSLEKSELPLAPYWPETSANCTVIMLTDGMQCHFPTQQKMEKNIIKTRQRLESLSMRLEI